jgi:hypothetical protein
MSAEICKETGRECPNSTRLALLEQRVSDIEAKQKKESDFRNSYYKEQQDRIRRDAQIDEKMSAMDEKLDKLLSWQEEQRSKPVKRWDTLVDKVVWAVVAAVIAFFLGRAGL